MGRVLTTDVPSATGSDTMFRWVGYDLAVGEAIALYATAGIGPDDVDGVEPHHAFASDEIIAYDALGLVEFGVGDGQVDGPRIALQHNLGLGGACVVGLPVRE